MHTIQKYRKINILHHSLKAVFYIGGGCGILWFLCWQLLMSDDPTTQRFINTTEKEYILKHRKQPMNDIGRKRPPYLKILLTPTVWVLMFTDFCISFGIWMILIEGPSFIDNILNKDILEVHRIFMNFLVESIKVFTLYLIV